MESSMNIMKQNKNEKIQGRLLKLFTITLIGCTSSQVIAQSSGGQPAETKTPPAASEPQSDKLDLGNLEQKYWSAKDDDFTVVQNRTFTKNRKFFVSAMTGRLVNDGFLEGSPTSFSFGYYLNEKNGLSVDYTTFATQDNSVTKAFVSRYGVAPAYNSPISTISLTYMWSPIYAKVSLLERKIMYLDMSIGVHVGTSSYKSMTADGGVKGSSSHYGIDISQLWFLNKNFALRFDVRNTWSTQKQYLFHIASTEPENTRSLGTTRLQDNTWLLGINYFFGK
jgi:outer membrane beta-barrel protein